MAGGRPRHPTKVPKVHAFGQVLEVCAGHVSSRRQQPFSNHHHIGDTPPIRSSNKMAEAFPVILKAAKDNDFRTMAAIVSKDPSKARAVNSIGQTGQSLKAFGRALITKPPYFTRFGQALEAKPSYLTSPGGQTI